MPVGFVLGWYRGVRSFIDPLINFFRALPPIALIPLVIVYFGIGESAKIAILFYASFFAGVIVMYEGVAQISPIFIRVARTLGATDAEVFRKVVLPLATGGTVAHLLAIDYSLRPVLVSLGARHITTGRFVLDTHIDHLSGGPVLVDESTRACIERTAAGFRAALGEAALESRPLLATPA